MNRPPTQSLSAVLASLCIHLTLLVGMALVIMGGVGQNMSGVRLLVDSSQDTAVDELTQLELTSNLPQNQSDEQAVTTTEIQGASEQTLFSSLVGDASQIALENRSALASGPSEISAEAAVAAMSAGSKSKRPRKNPGYGEGASFFGAYAQGQRFVFVIDSSQSMLEGTRWATLRRELIRAIKGLSPDQEFYVISFDIGAHPMFDLPPPKGGFLSPSDLNITQLNSWLNSIHHGGATLPASSIGIALRLQPDAIFLLSDGEIQDNTVQELRIFNRQREASGKTSVVIPIHTVLLHSKIGAATLRVIADENDGVFTPVSAISGDP